MICTEIAKLRDMFCEVTSNKMTVRECVGG